MITVITTRGMLYHKDTNTLVGVWSNSTNTLNAPPSRILVRGKQRDLAFNLTTHVGRRHTGDVCAVYEHRSAVYDRRNASDYYMLKMYYSRQDMEDWWSKARGN